MLKWVFGADTKPFQAGLAQMRTQTKAFSSNIGGMLSGALGAGAIIAGLKSFMTEMARIDDLSKRFGTSAETIQRVGNVAQLAGADIETVAKAMTKVTQNAVKAAHGGKEMSEAFASLGIDAVSFADLSMDEKLIILAQAFQDSGSQAEGLSAMMQILGKSGADLIPLLAEGPDNLKKQLAEVRVVAEGAVQSMAKMDDFIDSVAQGGKQSLGEVVQLFLAVGAAAKNLFKFIGAQNTNWLGDFEEIYMPEDNTPDKPLLEVDTESMDEVKKSQEERLKLSEEIAKLEEDSRQKQLSLEQKILEARHKLVQISKRPLTSNEKEAQEGYKEKLEVQAKLADLIKEQSDEQEKDSKKLADENAKLANDRAKEAEDAESQQKRIADLGEEEAKAQRDNKYSALSSDKERIALLQEEKRALIEKADNLDEGGDPEGAMKAKIEAIQKQGDIEEIIRSQASKTPTILAEDIRKAGGGGFARMTTVDPAREALGKYDMMIQKLDSIDRKTQPSTSTVPPPL